jgi:ribose transport system ATP-binding protein
MCDGRVTGCIDYEDVSQEAIMHLATLEAAGGAKQ